MQILKGHRGKVRSLDISPAGDQAVSCGGRGAAVSLWQLPKGKRAYLKGHHYPVFRVRFSPREGHLLTSDEFMSSRLWTRDVSAAGWASQRLDSAQAAFVNGGEEIVQLKYAYREVHGLYFAPLSAPNRGPVTVPFTVPGQSLLAGSPTTRDVAFTMYTTHRNGKRIHVYLAHPDRPQPREVGSLHDIPYAITFRDDGATVAVSTTSELARYEVASGTPLPLLRGHTRMITGLAYLSDGRLLSCSTDGTVRTWDHDSGKCLDTRDWQMGPLTAVCVAKDGMRAAVGSDNGEILIWDLA